MTHDRHAVPYQNPGEHKADRLCPCQPRPMRDLNEPGVVIWRHRGPDAGKPKPERAA